MGPPTVSHKSIRVIAEYRTEIYLRLNLVHERNLRCGWSPPINKHPSKYSADTLWALATFISCTANQLIWYTIRRFTIFSRMPLIIPFRKIINSRLYIGQALKNLWVVKMRPNRLTHALELVDWPMLFLYAFCQQWTINIETNKSKQFRRWNADRRFMCFLFGRIRFFKVLFMHSTQFYIFRLALPIHFFFCWPFTFFLCSICGWHFSDANTYSKRGMSTNSLWHRN